MNKLPTSEFTSSNKRLPLISTSVLKTWYFVFWLIFSIGTEGANVLLLLICVVAVLALKLPIGIDVSNTPVSSAIPIFSSHTKVLVCGLYFKIYSSVLKKSSFV